MLRAFRSEMLKFATTRMWWGMGIAVFLSGGLLSLLFALLFTGALGEDPREGLPPLDPTTLARTVYTAGLSLGYLLLLTVGVIHIAAEHRHHTITATFLAEPRRWRVMGAKALSLLVIGAAYGVVSILGSVLVGALTLSLRGEDAWPSSDLVRTLALSLLVLGLWALMGLGVGILIPNQVAAILIGVGVAWIVEPLLGLALRVSEVGREHIAPYLPTAATNAIVEGVAPDPTAVQLSWWGGALTLAAYAVVLAGVGAILTSRRDVS